jgi:alpha-N-arabinofuranosidase
VEPGTNPGFLYQQNTLRDALTGGLTLNIFNNHADRVKMANIAQTVNVLQAIILTNEDGLILTPTYHVFDLYQPHMEAKLLPSYLNGPQFSSDEESLDALSVSSSRSQDGTINITLVNVDPDNDIDLTCDIAGFESKSISGKFISSGKLNDHNSFDNPDVIGIKDLDGPKISKGKITATIPAKSVVLLQVK